jgi:hypothetical protein
VCVNDGDPSEHAVLQSGAVLMVTLDPSDRGYDWTKGRLTLEFCANR